MKIRDTGEFVATENETIVGSFQKQADGTYTLYIHSGFFDSAALGKLQKKLDKLNGVEEEA